MDCFVKYNEFDNLLEANCEFMVPNICKACIKNNDNKCIEHYKKLDTNNLVQCHNGFYSIRKKDDILTCLTPIGCRGLKDLKKKKEDTSNLIILEEKKIKEIIDEYYKLKDENDWLHAAIHDLKNIAMYFNTMEFNLKQDFPNEKNESFISMLELYNLIKYRLSLIGILPEQGYERYSIPIHSLLLKLIRILSYKAKNKKISFEIDQIDIRVQGNDHLYLAFFTLIDNAVKYAPPNSNVSFYFKQSDNELTVLIENIGPKIEEDEIELITGRGYRGKFNTNTSGNGVGLAVFKEICERCNYNYGFKAKYLNPSQSLFTAFIELTIVDE